jgi:predicted RNA binding protein YcfA (HicA-like mRNA interferase family)
MAFCSMVPHAVPCLVPPKIRDLERRLRKAGFAKEAARGSHRKWVHSSGRMVVMSGREGDDAKKYQEEQVEEAVSLIEKRTDS